jgi:hypothetical protein
MSPFKVTLGFEPTSPTTATFEDNYEPNCTLPEMHRFADDYVKAAQAHMQEAANRHRLPIPFTIGDIVKLKATNLRFVQHPCSKLRDRYIGPFLITEEVSLVAFRLKLPHGVQIHDVVHASLLERWNLDTKRAASAQPIPIVHDAKRFEVGQILDVAFNSNCTGLLFKIHWAAPFNVPSEDTWEPMRGVGHLNTFPEFLRPDVYRKFSATHDFVEFRSRWLARISKIPRP